MHYRAFLSYSHADEKWARWLMRRLESYRVPANLVGTHGLNGLIEAKLGKFFRDRDELPSAGSLSKTINDALEKSHALIVICSPTSAQSQWVNAEIDAFREKGNEDNILSFIVDGDPASRNPGIASFPYALIKPESEGEPEREPLAADARKQGDGRERAFIKLVAGLLGVGFDDLAQREAQQRHRRMAIITGASLLGMTLAVVLAVTAYIARNDAERRQAQAEDILGFMLGDLRKNLTKVGRLDLMRSVDDKATGYFATLNPRDLSDRALEEQARSLTGIGEVRLNEGNHKEAMISFREAHARSRALYQRAPNNGQRLFDLAQAEFWIGNVALQQSRFDEATIWLTQYRDSGVKLAAMDRNNFAWQREIAYGYQTLAALDESLGRYEAAEKGMLRLYNLYAKWMKQFPNDIEIRKGYADKISWLGSINLRQGKYKKAHDYFVELNSVYTNIVKQEPNNIISIKLGLDVKQLLVDSQVLLGKLDQAQISNKEAMQLAHKLVTNDPKNNVARLSYGISRFNDFELSSQKNIASLDDALVILNAAKNIEPENEAISLWLVRALLGKGRLHLMDNNTQEAFTTVAMANALVAPFFKGQPSEHMRKSKAIVLILEGEIQLKSNNADLATQTFGRARKLLEEKSETGIPFSRLYPLVLVIHLQGRKDEAAVYRERLEQSGFVPLTAYP